MNIKRKVLIIEAQAALDKKKSFTDWNEREVAGYNMMHGTTSKQIVCHNEFYETVKSLIQRAEENDAY